MIDLELFVKKLSTRDFPIPWPGQWAGGAWRPSRRGPLVKASINPNDTREKLIEVSLDKESVAQAIDGADKARRDFAATTMTARLEIIERFRQMLADYQDAAQLTLRIEAGKPLWEAQEDVAAALRYLEWVVKNGEHINSELLAPARLGPQQGAFVMLPIGVTVAYIPFSTPITSFAFYFAAAMLAGCPLIVNSSAHALLSCMFLALIAEKLDLPAGVFNVVFGNFSSFRQMLTDRRVAAVLYTGSREHCDTIRTESKISLGRQVVLQSGGKNAVIVHSSADLDAAVRCVIQGAFTSAGQRCSSTSRVFVYRSHLHDFMERLTEAVKAIKIGRTDLDVEGDAGPTMGPLYSDKAVEKFLRFQTMANREADKTLLWGRGIESAQHGNFVTPGIHYVAKFDNSTAYQGNVLFCPDVAIYDYDVLDTAIEQINTTDAAFAVSFIGESTAIEERRHLFLAPNLLVNIPTIETEATLPLAGRLQAGHHRYHGPGVALYLCYPQVLCR